MHAEVKTVKPKVSWLLGVMWQGLRRIVRKHLKDKWRKRHIEFHVHSLLMLSLLTHCFVLSILHSASTDLFPRNRILASIQCSFCAWGDVIGASLA